MRNATTVLRRVESFAPVPFQYIESRRLLQLAARVEHVLESSEALLRIERLDADAHQERIERLRRRIDALAEISRELMEQL